jgi:hypothetical protein
MVRSLDVGRVEPYLTHLLGSGAHSLRQDLRAFARDHGILVDENGR